MIIYADIRPLIVTGIVLFLTNFGWNYPLPLKRKLQVPGKRMVMTKKSCQDPIGNRGTCMFKYDCIRQKGITLSTCVDGFLFGACCFIKEDSIQIISKDIHSNSTHLVDYKGHNKTIYNFYQIESEATLKNSTEYSRPIEEILNTSLNISSNENSQENSTISLPDLLNISKSKLSTTNPSSDIVNNLTTVVGVFNKQIYNNTGHILKEDFTNFSKSTVSDYTTFVTRPIDYNEESVIDNKSSSLGHSIQSVMRTNNTNDLPVSLSLTDVHPIPSFEPSEKVQIEEYRNQFTSISPFDDSAKENNTAVITNYFNEEKESENENSTALNRHILTKLNSTEVFLNTNEPFLQNINITAEKTFQLDETEELTNNPLSSDHNNVIIQPSVSAESYNASSFEINFSTIPEKEPTKFYNVTKKSEFGNLITSDETFSTESTKNSTTLSTFETPSIETSSESTNLELTLIANSVSQNYLKLNEVEEKESFNTNITSANLDDIENTTFYYKSPKSPNDSTTTFDSKSNNSDDKKTTKAMILPTLPWSSNSILPESFQSVISQLIEQKISSPGNFISDYETQATPTVYVNTFVDQSLSLDSEESVKLEFKSPNISEFSDNDYEEIENYYLSEFIQNSNTNPPEVDDFASTPSTDSPLGLNDNEFEDNNKNILLIPNILIKDLTTNEENIESTENTKTNFPSRDGLDITSDEYYTKKFSQTVEGFKYTPGGERPQLSVSTFSSLDLLTEESTSYTKFLQSNLDPYTNAILFSAQTEPYTIPSTIFQDNNNQEEHVTPLSILHISDQSVSESSALFSTVQSQSLDNSLYDVTKFSATLTKEVTTNNYHTVIQIINNHTGKNSSAINISNHIKDTNESYVNTALAQSENTGTSEGITINPIVNNNLENNSSLYKTETLIKTSTPVILNIDDFEESQQVDESIYPDINTDTSNSFNESVDSSQSSSFEIIPSYTNFNSANIFPSILIDSSTSPFTTIVHDETKDMELNLTDFEEQYLSHTDEPSIESTGDPYNVIITGDEHPTGFSNHLDGSSDNPTTKTKSTYNIISLNFSDASSLDDSHGSQITTELSFAETSVFTTNSTEISETVSPHMFDTFPDIATFADMENSTLSDSSPPDLNASDVSATTAALETISSSTSTYTAITQNIDFLTHGDAFSSTSHEYSVVHLTENTTSSTMLTSESPSIESDETVNTDRLTNLATQTYSTPVPATTTAPKVNIHRWNYKKDCGVRLMQPVGRIVGGKNTYFGKWPWQALVKEATWLGLFVKNKCGGVLITSKYVLTAAHCQPGFLASLLVVLGTHDLAETFDNKASIIRNVKRMVVHRHYNAQTFENDLALLEMEAAVEFLPYVVPICLPHRYEDFTGNMAFVTGWGKLTAGGDVPNILQEVQVPIVSNGECQSMFYQAGHHKAIRSNFVCAGYTNGGQDSCEGDSGGPLMVQREDTRWVLVGTVSHGIGCADPNLPGVYMRMSSYKPWIDSIIYK